MPSDISLGHVGSLRVSAQPSAITGSIGLAALLSFVGVRWLKLSPGKALAGSVAAVSLHWLSDLVHHLAHARAARKTGYPMTGIRAWGVLASSVYPTDEPPLPGSVHIRRALGGPAGSAGVAAGTAILARLLWRRGGLARWVSLFAFLDNFFILSFGALVPPLPINDGSTLLRWWGKD